MPTSSENQAAIVTGASRGIGLSIAAALVRDGFKVCITGRGEPGLIEAVESLGGSARATYVPGRADDPSHQRAVVEATMDRFGRIDVLVNNAGINPAFGPIVSIDLGAARKTLEVNVLGALAWTQAVYGAWMRDNGGVIVNLASAAGVQAAEGIGGYGVSKAALIALTRQLGYELGPTIRVNAVAPAIVKTRFAGALYEGREDEVAGKYPLARLGVPDDIAEAVAFLAGERSSWITGQTIVLDGGLMLGGRL
jgi:NAD(P)-dependent dehydrogenase (short-subunit alcohol dehydrogenase family)